MPNRILKDSICTSDSVDTLTWFEEAFFYRLIVNCDDYGRMDARPAILRARLFPLKTVTNNQIECALQSLRTAGMADLYEVDGKPFLQLRTWEKHQSVRAKRSKYPSPENISQQPENNCMQMQADESKCPRNPIQSESESYSESESNADKSEVSLCGAMSGKTKKSAKGKDCAPPYDEFGFSETMRQKLDEWIRYKSELGKPYKPMGLNSMLKTVSREISRLGEQAVLDRITDAMGNGWQGMNLDKVDVRQTGKGTTGPMQDWEQDWLAEVKSRRKQHD